MSYFIARGREKVGPLPLAELRRMAAAGSLGPSDMVLREGEPRWRKAESVDGLPFVAPEPPPPPSAAEAELKAAAVSIDADDARPDAAAPEPPARGWLGAPRLARVRGWLAGPDSRPWDPRVLLGFGVLFGIPWLCVCSAINAARLRGPCRWWRPLLVGGAALAASALVGAVAGLAGDSWLAFFLLRLPAFAGAYLALWHFDTRPQLAAFRAWRGRGGQAAAWWKPALAGFALTALVLAIDWVLAPAPPGRVCARFERAWAARDDAAMREHAHPRLYHTPRAPSPSWRASRTATPASSWSATPSGPTARPCRPSRGGSSSSTSGARSTARSCWRGGGGAGWSGRSCTGTARATTPSP
jgi:hypothetical protein